MDLDQLEIEISVIYKGENIELTYKEEHKEGEEE